MDDIEWWDGEWLEADDGTTITPAPNPKEQGSLDLWQEEFRRDTGAAPPVTKWVGAGQRKEK